MEKLFPPRFTVCSSRFRVVKLEDSFCSFCDVESLGLLWTSQLQLSESRFLSIDNRLFLSLRRGNLNAFLMFRPSPSQTIPFPAQAANDDEPVDVIADLKSEIPTLR
jgi:hypothetical protein